MITRQLLKTPASPTGAPTDPSALDPYVEDAYFTDGSNLYRLAGWLTRPTQPALVELEDCRSLHCVLIDRDELVALGLRPVVRA